MKILITGINGLVGKDIGRFLGINTEYEIYGIGRAQCYIPYVNYTMLDLLDFEKLQKYLYRVKPDAIIHCAAITRIDQCEDDREVALKTNADVPGIIAEYGCRMIYISSDAVFDGQTGEYTEDSSVCPLSYYGKTKWMGEDIVKKNNKNSVILRTSIYGYHNNGNQSVPQWAADNIKHRREMKGFTDVITNPLYPSQIAEVINKLLHNRYAGVMNIGCKERVSRYDLFCRIARFMGIVPDFISPVSVDSMNFKAPRTKNTVLNTELMGKTLGIEFSVEEGLRQFYYDYLKWL